MAAKVEDKETRYFVDLDLESLTVLKWDYGQREILVSQKMEKQSHHRIFITKGQYNKLVRKKTELDERR